MMKEQIKKNPKETRRRISRTRLVAVSLMNGFIWTSAIYTMFTIVWNVCNDGFEKLKPLIGIALIITYISIICKAILFIYHSTRKSFTTAEVLSWVNDITIVQSVNYREINMIMDIYQHNIEQCHRLRLSEHSSYMNISLTENQVYRLNNIWRIRCNEMSPVLYPNGSKVAYAFEQFQSFLSDYERDKARPIPLAELELILWMVVGIKSLLSNELS